MVYTQIYERNVSTVSQLFLYVSDVVPAFIPMMLFSIFCIVALSTHFAQLRTRGYSNILTSLAVAGYFTSVITVTLSMIPNLINGYILIVTIVATIIFTALMFIGRGER